MSTDLPTRRAPNWLGAASAGLAVAAIVGEGFAIGIASDGGWGQATVLAWLVIVLTAAAFFGGLVATVVGLGRGAGMAAMVLGLVGNPLVLIWLLGALGTS
ncbi:MAG TPA: hypothetical protein VGC18_10510 [Lacisediminihabitans sp.]|uniref:hypothetical protein n=1 Tax=Lacisediminihabitans sp. TaxID=2787631 RepID=UPI002EDA0661